MEAAINDAGGLEDDARPSSDAYVDLSDHADEDKWSHSKLLKSDHQPLCFHAHLSKLCHHKKK